MKVFIIYWGCFQLSHDVMTSTPRITGVSVHLDTSKPTTTYRSSRLACCHRVADASALSLVLETPEVPRPVLTMERKDGFHDTRDGEWVTFFSVRGRRGVNRVLDAKEHAVQSASGVYIIFDVGTTWRLMSASVR